MNTFGGSLTNFRHSVRRSLNRQKQQFNCSRRTSSSAETSLDETQQIIIPKRIERGPTDILKALASTVKKDYLAPHYKYHDDPFLIPTSNMAKRMFALSQESGRKSAQWIRQEHADLFQHKVSDPPIEAFFPRAVYDENSEVDETVLDKVIAQHRVSDALTIYGLLEKKNVELSRNTLQKLLELLCYYNHEDTIEEEWIEERWFKQSQRNREKKMKTWKSGNAADKLFEKMTPPDVLSYAALICGKAQFGDMEGAYRLFQEALDARLTLPVEAFNKVIGGGHILKEGHELRWKFVEEILSAMHQYGVSPNLDTLNAILETLSTMSTNRLSRDHALAIITELRAVGVEPSLASYYFLLKIFCQNRSSTRSSVLVSILNTLEGQSLAIRDPRDVLFFTEAMDVCRYHLSDLDTALRLDRLLHTGDNYNLIGDSYKESLYYRNFLALSCQMGTLKDFMELYDKLVPNIYVPEPGIMEYIIKTTEINEAWELLPRFWKDVVKFEQADREPILCALLTALKSSATEDVTLLEQHADVAWDMWQKVENQRESRVGNKISWTGSMLGDIVQVLLRADRYQQAVEVMACVDKRQQEILGVPSIESLIAFLNKSIERKDTKNAMWCVQYCLQAGFEETLEMAQKLNSSLKLSDVDKTVLVNLVGRDAVKEEAAVSS